MNGKLVSPLKRLGGKANLCRWIRQNLPDHEQYVEVFGGSAPVLLTKAPAVRKEVFNDLDGLWCNSLLVVRDHGKELADGLSATPYSRQTFETAKAAIKSWRTGELVLDKVPLAIHHFVIVRQSFSADCKSWSTSAFAGENRARLWASLPPQMARWSKRLQGVVIEQRDYHYILDRYDHGRTTFYCDPPYWDVENKYYDANRKDGFDHAELRKSLENRQGSIVVSYYDDQAGMVRDLYRGWEVLDRQVIVHAGDVKRAVTELLLIRYGAWAKRTARKQLQELFDEDGTACISTVIAMITGADE